jgi:SAM-dependent methyltransferase
VTSPPTPPNSAATAFAVRMWMACLATQELFTVYLGVRLGIYAELAAGGPGTVAELARRTGVAHRYLLEWLEQQAVAGILGVAGVGGDPQRRVYSLPAQARQVLIESDDPLSLASLAVLPLGAVAQALPVLSAAYRTGAGVPDEAYGEDWRRGHSGANRALFRHLLAGWIRAALPDVHARLGAGGARVADVACGAGWAALAIAEAYPGVEVRGYDIDAELIKQAIGQARLAGLDDRVSFEVRDCTAAPEAEAFQLVCLFDALHELPRPVEVLRACRAMRAPDAAVLVMDARVAETFRAPADEVERFQYATSVLHCLPAAMSGPDSAATGTVMRPDTVRAYARAAGFLDAVVLPVQERFHRLYRLG